MDTTAIDTALQRAIDEDRLPGVSYTLLRGGEPVATRCLGYADLETREPLREDHLLRIYSNTKLVTSLAALQLVAQGRLRLDQPVGELVPSLASLRVLRPGATRLDDVEFARQPVRVRHVLTHTAGFTYAFTEPQSLLGRAYQDAEIGSPSSTVATRRTLAEHVDALAQLPLKFEPGTAWNYSAATDVVGRLVEVVSGLALDEYFRRHVFEPLGMNDTGFVVPPGQQQRLVPMYVGDPQEPGRPGLKRMADFPYPGAWLRPVPLLDPGGGLVSSLADYTRLVQCLVLGGAPLLPPEAMPNVMHNRLPPGMSIGFPGQPLQVGRGHGFVSGVQFAAGPLDPSAAPGDLGWGGLAGTNWWISPSRDLAVVLMTQRYMGFGLPFWTEFKANVLRAMGA